MKRLQTTDTYDQAFAHALIMALALVLAFGVVASCVLSLAWRIA